MNLIILTALVAVCGAAKLDRTYLPPASASTAGGSSADIQAPFTGPTFRGQGNQGLGGIPKGAYSNDFEGVIVDAAAAGTRASGPVETGLGAPRPSYGSEASRVGEAAFRTQTAGFRQPLGPQNGQASSEAFASNGQVSKFQPSFSAQPVEAERPNAEQDRAANVVRYDSEVGTDTFNYGFETDNGISAEENGVATNGVQAQGAFSYKADDGQTYSVTYTADENGYQPVGDHLPTPPPIPEAILKSLEQNARDEAAGINDDGSYDAKKYSVGNDHNGGDNDNGQYNSALNRGSANGNKAFDATASGTFNQNNAQPFEQGQDASASQEFRQPFDKQTNGNNFNTFSQNANRPSNSASSSAFVQSSSNIKQSTQFPTKSNNGFGGSNAQYSQEQQNSFSNQNQGYLPPVGNTDGQQNKPAQVLQTPVPEAPTAQPFPSHQFSQNKEQTQFSNGNNLNRPDSQQEPTSSSSFASAQFSSQKPQAQYNQFNQQTQTRFQESQSSFSRPTSSAPTNQPVNGFVRVPQLPSSRPQSYRQQGNIPQHVASAPTNAPQSSASAFASFGSQTSSANKFNANLELAPQSPDNQQPELQPQVPENDFSQPKPSFGVKPNQNTQRPFSAQNGFGQAQKQDDSYYYNQPAQPFHTPQFQAQSPTFSSSSSAQFNAPTQKPFSAQSSAQYTTNQQEIQTPTFQSVGSTRYPRPPTVAPTFTPTSDAQKTETFPPQYNGVTQAEASSFPAPSPTSQYQSNAKPLRPAVPGFQSQNSAQAQAEVQTGFQRKPFSQQPYNQKTTTQSGQNFQSQKQMSQYEQPSQQSTASAQAFSQQPAFDQMQTTQSGQQYQSQEQTQTTQNEEPSQQSTAPVQTQQYNTEIYEYKKPASSLPPPDTTPQGTEQTSVNAGDNSAQFSQQNQAQFAVQGQSQQGNNRPQFNLQGQNQQNLKPQFGQSFNAQASSQVFKADEQSSRYTAGQGEIFGGPRKPPSFDEQTGYHY